jgi:hypothetical protein
METQIGKNMDFINKVSRRHFFTIALALSVVACGSDSDSDESGGGSTTVPTTQLYDLGGVVADYYTNDVVEGSTINISQDGAVLATAVADANGEWQIDVLSTDVDPNASFIVSGDALGFSESAQEFSLQELLDGANLSLPAVHSSTSFNGAEAAALAVDGNTLVELDADSFVNAAGELVTGNIDAELFVIDPATDINLMPGEMVTLDENNLEAPIESFGAITANFYDENGQGLQLVEGATADIRIPASGTNPPATVPLYYFDDTRGLWVEEGEATLVNGFYEGVVSHFTTWNADKIFETVMYYGCVVDNQGAAISNARIVSRGVDYNGTSSTYSDSEGQFSMPVRMSSVVLLSAVNEYQSRTRQVATTTEDYTDPNCLVLDEAITKITLTWGEAPSDLDSHLYGPNGIVDGEDQGRFHVYYGDREHLLNGDTIYLDVDDTSSFGPEVISIPKFTVAGVYKYSVYNYSGSPDISSSETLVEAIVDGVRYPIVPTSGEAMRWWHVLEIVVAEDLTFTVNIVNQWSSVNPDLTGNALVPLRAQSIEVDGSIADRLLEEKYYSE